MRAEGASGRATGRPRSHQYRAPARAHMTRTIQTMIRIDSGLGLCSLGVSDVMPIL